MASYVVSLTVDTVIEDLASFLTPFLPAGTPIVRGQQNRVPPPADPFVKLTEVTQADIETPSTSDADQITTITSPTRIDIQVDFYGPSAGDYCRAVKSVWRTPYTAAQFPANIQPLYCSDGIQAPLITGEQQYDAHWIMTASLQYNPAVSLPQQSANSLKVNIFEDLQ